MKKIYCSIIAGVTMLTGCVSKPDNIIPVNNFQADKYLGKWYEIARSDNSFEKGLTDVYAEYALNKDSTIKVTNSGIDPIKKKRVYANGVAKFVENSSLGYLKVSFFRPFYASYVIFYLDDYKYAYVAGPNTNYVWLLARTPSVSDTIKNDFIAKIKSLGFDTDSLVWVKHDR